MRNELEFAGYRFTVFARQVLEPAVYGPGVPLSVAAFQCRDPIPYAQAVRETYQPVELGWRWGPVWSTAWFRLQGRVPAALRGQTVTLRFSSGTEALLWRDGTPHSGLDLNHQAAVLLAPAAGDEDLCLFVEAACNHTLGTVAVPWHESELNRRWSEPNPGRLERCELAAYNADVWRLWREYEFARQLLLLMPEDSPRGRRLAAVLHRVTDLIDDTDVAGTAAAAREVLLAELCDAPERPPRCYAVGHAHIDTAWLWPLRETRRKCQRTFASVLGLMDAYPGLHFLCSQAQQYAWLAERSPELFARITQRVREGRWEPAGAMWVEPDCNVPSGESLVRQILHGTRYWEQMFGERGRQTCLFLPDTFGFNAALPQIMALAGLEVFITNKLNYTDTNEFPYTHFRWRGLDGTEVLAHYMPGRDYNCANTPAEFQQAERKMARLDPAGMGLWMQPFGYGDGGGGPTAEMIEHAQLAECCDGLPPVQLSSAAAFCERLRQRRTELQAAGRDLPLWDGELYLESHRGTYTTQGWLKRANRQAEQALRTAEWLSSAGPGPAPAASPGLDAAWKLLLLNQFHDILPGSSITAVYDEARQHHVRIRDAADTLSAEALRAWTLAAHTVGLQEPLLVLNPASARRAGVVNCAGRLHYVADVPPLGAAVIDRAKPTHVEPVRVKGRTLTNGQLSVTIDEAGQIVSLRRAGLERDACRQRPAGSPEPLNQLALYDDRPRAWDAWDIDPDYENKTFPVVGPAETWHVADANPLRAVIEVSRPLGRASRLTQRFSLEAGAARLDIHTRVDWHENHRLLRVRFPVDVRARSATYEVQFGCLERPTHRNTSWEQARFEVCAQRWMDLSERGFGVALLNDGKYGHSCHDGVIGMSLLRSPLWPDPQADRGTNEFTYSLMVHDGDWRAAGVDQEAEALNAPLIAQPLPAEQLGSIRDRWGPFHIDTGGLAGVQVAAVKRAEADDRLIVRLVEVHGGRGRMTVNWALPVEAVEAVDLLERPLALAGFAHDPAARRTTVDLRPFQIVTLAARRA